MAGFGARTGGAYAAHRARTGVRLDDRREELNDAFALRTAEQVAAELGNLKGAMMKLGQMASYLDQGLPVAHPDRPGRAPPGRPADERGAGGRRRPGRAGPGPDELFAEWDPVPLASASIGQVHRAVTHDDRAVAVKIQYPGVDEAIRADLDNVDALFGAAGFVFSGLDPDALVIELKERLVEELDYRLEADNQRLFVEYYRDHPFIHIPDVVDELSTGRVLTTELSPGVRWDEVLTWSQEERDLAGEAIFRFVFRSLYRLHAFNGDPHPGNYLFAAGGPGDLPRLRPGQAVHRRRGVPLPRPHRRLRPAGRPDRLPAPHRAGRAPPGRRRPQRRAGRRAGWATSTSSCWRTAPPRSRPSTRVRR